LPASQSTITSNDPEENEERNQRNDERDSAVNEGREEEDAWTIEYLSNKAHEQNNAKQKQSNMSTAVLSISGTEAAGIHAFVQESETVAFDTRLLQTSTSESDDVAAKQDTGARGEDTWTIEYLSNKAHEVCSPMSINYAASTLTRSACGVDVSFKFEKATSSVTTEEEADATEHQTITYAKVETIPPSPGKTISTETVKDAPSNNRAEESWMNQLSKQVQSMHTSINEYTSTLMKHLNDQFQVESKPMKVQEKWADISSE